ncbi:MAG TPA: magnesium transporter CorA family protein [Candidatus Saccharimonadales bacterium]|nr:magnesium transporter CorA family protein [Candidatus Saccharimonadales bacterium]
MATTYYSQARQRALQKLSDPRAGSWIVVEGPTEADLDELAEIYKLNRDNLADAVDIYEAPRVQVDDGAVYMYTRFCYPEGHEIATEPLLIVSNSDYLFTIVRTKTTILARLQDNTLDVVTTQRTKTVLQIFAEINRSYELQLTKLSRRILQLRAHMRQSQLTTREFVSLIELEEDMNEFLSALQPQALLFRSLLSGKYLRLYEQDRDIIEDIELDTGELITQVQGRLRTLVNMRQSYDAIATTNLNNTFKRLTSIAIFLTVPTIIGGIYGMNVTLPLQHTQHAFLFVLGVIAVITTGMVALFKYKKWF